MDAHARRRAHMVEVDLRGRGIRDERVLQAMGTVPRERFVPPHLVDAAYTDGALPLTEGQTISQPYVVAAMAEAAGVGPGDRVLEVGTGSGYGAAVLAATGADVVTVERHASLAESARALLAEVAPGVRVVEGDGSLGWPEGAPWDAIVVTAAGPEVPAALRTQLADGGRLVMPVGPKGHQQLTRLVRDGDEVDVQRLGGVAFVPLVGDQGW
jgi:protein-L-isoaspartate(D-aspartate) O-methyltransferase